MPEKKLANKKEHIGHINISSIFNAWLFDFVEPLTKTENGNQQLIIGVEHMWELSIARFYTSFFFNSDGVIKLMKEEIINSFGHFEYIIRDNDLKFDSSRINEESTGGIPRHIIRKVQEQQGERSGSSTNRCSA